MNKVSESIVTVGMNVIPMAEVSHAKKLRASCDLHSGLKQGDAYGCLVFFKHSKMDENGDLQPCVQLSEADSAKFFDAWMFYRHELEGGAEAFKGPE